MTLTLSPEIAAMLAAWNAHDVDGLVDCFTPDATVRDEGRRHHGPAAIRAWFEELCDRSAPRIEVTAIAEADGETILTVSVDGERAGGLSERRYVVATEDERIVALRIVP
ncbi:nuclear transport factor 2 family protein [Opitutus terrae]|uniref:SnoaL-like domain-containing protein n=1 Tax=Opitutus terrae (strain DSM 11246 / JCM 15787 / PB90-1) TaxID=452637 RepID=B1ZNT4_OPITP|nr:nuclear transport factor 2 family protein [Opitutus terrae]ACB75454.1 conserved hypothetical protein [Opitutus terrae PB90-1]